MKAKANGTPVYTRQHSRGLTLPQMSAIDLLVTGKSDTETAAALRLSRTCVSKWRLYDVEFQAALNRRRTEVWGATADRLRDLIPKALDALAAELEAAGPHRVKAAVELLRLASPAAAPPAAPTDPEEVVRGIVAERRGRARGVFDNMREDGKGLPPFEQHVEQVRQELEAKLAEPETTDAESVSM